MMSRLYPSTRILYGQVHAILVMLSDNPLFTPRPNLGWCVCT